MIQTNSRSSHLELYELYEQYHYNDCTYQGNAVSVNRGHLAWEVHMYTSNVITFLSFTAIPASLDNTESIRQYVFAVL